MITLKKLCLVLAAGTVVASPVLAETILPKAQAVPRQEYTYGALVGMTGHAIYVAVNGSDTHGNGSEKKPYATAGVASLHARPGDVIVMKSGRYKAFGAIRNSGTAEQPIIIRPEPNGEVTYEMSKPYAGIEIAASHVRLFGIEVISSHGHIEGPCVLLTRHVSDIALRDLRLNACGTGIRLSQPGASGTDILLEDISIDGGELGIVCDTCRNVTIRRTRLNAILRSDDAFATGFLFGADTSGMIIEDSEIVDSAANGIESEGKDILVSNSAIHQLSGSPVILSNGGTVNNCDLRDNRLPPVLRGGGTYRWRGNLTEYEETDADGFGFRVEYDKQNSDQLTTLLLDANRFVIPSGGLGLPSVRDNASAPLLVTMRSNTFFFLKPASFAALPGGRRVSPEEFASASGTGIVNLGSNVSVVSAPTGDDLLSPVYVGGDSRSLPLGLLLFPGARIKGSGPTVYLYANDGKRHTFPSESVYRSWYNGYDGIITLSDEALSVLPLGRNVINRPGARLVKLTTDPKVYAVDSEGFLRWVQTEEIARALYGADWNKKVDDIVDTTFMDYGIRPPIANADDFRPNAERAEISNPSELF